MSVPGPAGLSTNAGSEGAVVEDAALGVAISTPATGEDDREGNWEGPVCACVCGGGGEEGKGANQGRGMCVCVCMYA
jgi:hypothetical protein